ncbi:MAG TPA: ABC transporter substrate-binding protein [Usitatibacter sp.]|jgi:polar amino acid transport system substrate-binding protein|nr:ABC transporter substrate-binding protein [Usitatibacter sp.]
MTSPVPDSLRHALAPTGTLRAGINLGNPVIAQKDPAGGAPRGVGPDLARELAKRVGVGIAYVTYETAGKLADGVRQDAWDVAFLAGEPERAAEIAFSPPYVQIEGTYLVPRDSPLKSVADVDRAGIRVCVGDKTAYDLYLTRNLKHAELVRWPTSLEAIAMFREQGLDAAAGVRQPLMAAARVDPGLRVMDASFMVIRQACGVPKGRDEAARYLSRFIEEMKASGFVKRALEASGNGDVTVAPAGR